MEIGVQDFRSVWFDGFRKDMDGVRVTRHQWHDLIVLFSGGGLRRASLETAIRDEPFLRNYFQCHNPTYEVCSYNPSGLEFLGPPKFNSSDTLTYLAVAHGLSLERQRWPTF